MYKVEELILSYIKNPGKYWDGNKRQEEKTARRVYKLKDYYGWSDRDLVFYSIQAAQRRFVRKDKTLYMPSFGASGSHLFQHIISLATRCIPLGEVYIAPQLIKSAQPFCLADRKLLMEAYHLVHCGEPNNLLSSSIIINTAHKPSLQVYSSWTNNYKSCLIMRNPVDIVISRTFRKSEYRNYLHNINITDLDYLKENTSKTKRFYNSAIKFPHDYWVRFEDLFENTARVAYTLSEILGGLTTKELLSKFIDQALATGEKTNKFNGNQPNIDPAFVAFAEKELMDISATMNSRL